MSTHDQPQSDDWIEQRALVLSTLTRLEGKVDKLDDKLQLLSLKVIGVSSVVSGVCMLLVKYIF